MAINRISRAMVALAALILPLSTLAKIEGTPGRLQFLGFSVETADGLPFDNPQAEATPQNVVVVHWNETLDQNTVEGLNLWVASLGYANSSASSNSSCQGCDYRVQSVNMTTHHFTIMYNPSDEAVSKVADAKEVVSIERDSVISTFGQLAQTNSPDGLNRISSAKPGSKMYRFDDSLGKGIMVYVVDTGINTNHTEFSGGRATWGANFVPDSPVSSLSPALPFSPFDQ